jgi:hypothetical protein
MRATADRGLTTRSARTRRRAARVAIAGRGATAAIAAALLAALALAACGSSGTTAGGSAGGHSLLLAYSQCMRAHGVTHFPDPSGGGGIHIDGSTINPFAPAFRAAQSTCRKLLPGGGPGGRKPTEQDKLAMFHISQCMRSHGVTGFPDPIYAPPSSPQGYGLVENRNGVILAIPQTINVNSPAFMQASHICGFQ